MKRLLLIVLFLAFVAAPVQAAMEVSCSAESCGCGAEMQGACDMACSDTPAQRDSVAPAVLPLAGTKFLLASAGAAADSYQGLSSFDIFERIDTSRKAPRPPPLKTYLQNCSFLC